MRTRQPDVEVLNRLDCVRLLSSVPFGRLVYTSCALPAVQPVNFVIRDDAVVFRTASDSKLAVASAGHVVAFQADSIDTHGRSGWSITVVGRCSEIVELAALAELAVCGPAAWGTPDSERFIAIRIEQITGRWLHSAVASVG